MYKLYLDTSVISALFDGKNPERQELTKLFFNNLNRFDVYVSELTLAEINNTPDSSLKTKMISTVK